MNMFMTFVLFIYETPTRVHTQRQIMYFTGVSGSSVYGIDKNISKQLHSTAPDFAQVVSTGFAWDEGRGTVMLNCIPKEEEVFFTGTLWKRKEERRFLDET